VSAAAAEDLDFSDIKKKKKSTKKKTTFDLEAFEKELNDSKVEDSKVEDSKVEDIAAEEEGDELEQLPEMDEAELGDDPFAQPGDVPTGIDAGNEAWLKSDRDYTYPEVHNFILTCSKS
jgi:translation initiation factor 2 subunit 2